MCSYGSAVKWHPKRHGSATEHHHIYSAGNDLHWSCLLGPAIHVKHRFLKRNSPVLSCNFGHFNAESWRPFRADLLGELQVLAPQQRLVIFSPGGCHLVKVCLPFYSLFLIFITLFFSWSAAVVSGWWGVKVILTVYPLPPHLYWENTVPILCQCRLQCHPAGASQQPVWPQTRLWLRAAWRCPFPPLYRRFFSWCCHMFCHWLSYIEVKGERCPAVSFQQSAPPHRGIGHMVILLYHGVAYYFDRKFVLAFRFTAWFLNIWLFSLICLVKPILKLFLPKFFAHFTFKVDF